MDAAEGWADSGDTGGAGHPAAPSMLVDPVALVRAATGPDPSAGLEAVARLRPLLDAWEDYQVGRARDGGWNWAEIAKRLGRHRQAVHREYARRNRPTDLRAGASGA